MITTATTDTYTLSLHDALPISLQRARRKRQRRPVRRDEHGRCARAGDPGSHHRGLLERRRSGRHDVDRKSTRLNSSHSQISYAVFCLKKKKKNKLAYAKFKMPK